tara:strand:+ start:3179 stop:3640 length:462 start_codon:yes stop_codon:yes gene_type:complete
MKELKRLGEDIKIKPIEDILPKRNFLDPKQHKLFGKKSRLTFGQKAADVIASFGGSWTFILLFAFFFGGWMYLNVKILTQDPFDPYPFILLNLVLSCLAAIQAPVILMSQNRASERDRLRAEYDYTVNRRAEKEIRNIQKDIEMIKKSLKIKD